MSSLLHAIVCHRQTVTLLSRNRIVRNSFGSALYINSYHTGRAVMERFYNNVKKTVTNDLKVDKKIEKAVVVEQVVQHKALKESCGDVSNFDLELEELEDMFIQGPKGIEWNGPTRGGARPEPTRYGDWERKGRCSDF